MNSILVYLSFVRFELIPDANKTVSYSCMVVQEKHSH